MPESAPPSVVPAAPAPAEVNGVHRVIGPAPEPPQPLLGVTDPTPLSAPPRPPPAGGGEGAPRGLRPAAGPPPPPPRRAPPPPPPPPTPRPRRSTRPGRPRPAAEPAAAARVVLRHRGPVRPARL